MTKAELAERLAALINEYIDGVTRRMVAAINGGTTSAAVKPRPTPKGKARKQPTARAKIPTCSRCGKKGFNAKTCGRTHNVKTKGVHRDGGPGWTPDEDRKEEALALSELSALRKVS